MSSTEEMIREMEKMMAKEATYMYEKLHKKIFKYNITIKKPILYGPPIRIDIDSTCDFERGAWRHKVYHVVFGGRGPSYTLCGLHVMRKNVWVAYPEMGVAYTPPFGKKTCKRCAAHEDYVLHQLGAA